MGLSREELSRELGKRIIVPVPDRKRDRFKEIGSDLREVLPDPSLDGSGTLKRALVQSVGTGLRILSGVSNQMRITFLVSEGIPNQDSILDSSSFASVNSELFDGVELFGTFEAFLVEWESDPGTTPLKCRIIKPPNRTVPIATATAASMPGQIYDVFQGLEFTVAPATLTAFYDDGNPAATAGGPFSLGEGIGDTFLSGPHTSNRRRMFLRVVQTDNDTNTNTFLVGGFYDGQGTPETSLAYYSAFNRRVIDGGVTGGFAVTDDPVRVSAFEAVPTTLESALAGGVGNGIVIPGGKLWLAVANGNAASPTITFKAWLSFGTP